MKLLTLALLMLPGLCQAQNEKDPSKPSIGIIFSPDYSYRHFGNNSSPLAQFYNSVEQPSFGYTAGFMCAFSLHANLKFEGGIMFANKGYHTIRYKEESPGVIYVNGNIVPLDTRSYSYNHYFIDIPLKANYYLTKKKLRFYGTAGLNPGIYLTTHSVYSFFYTDGSTQEFNNTQRYSVFHKFQFGTLAGLGVEFNLGSILYLKFEPVFRYTFTALSDEVVKPHLYSAGINCGVYYKF